MVPPYRGVSALPPVAAESDLLVPAQAAVSPTAPVSNAARMNLRAAIRASFTSQFRVGGFELGADIGEAADHVLGGSGEGQPEAPGPGRPEGRTGSHGSAGPIEQAPGELGAVLGGQREPQVEGAGRPRRGQTQPFGRG